MFCWLLSAAGKIHINIVNKTAILRFYLRFAQTVKENMSVWKEISKYVDGGDAMIRILRPMRLVR